MSEDPQELEPEDAIARLRNHIQSRHNNTADFARSNNISESYIRRVLKGEVPLSDKLCQILCITKHRLVIHFYTLDESAPNEPPQN